MSNHNPTIRIYLPMLVTTTTAARILATANPRKSGIFPIDTSLYGLQPIFPKAHTRLHVRVSTQRQLLHGLCVFQWSPRFLSA